MKKLGKILFTVITPIVIVCIIDAFIELPEMIRIFIQSILLAIMIEVFNNKNAANRKKEFNKKHLFLSLIFGIISLIPLYFLYTNTQIQIDSWLLMDVKMLLCMLFSGCFWITFINLYRYGRNKCTEL